MVPAAEPGFVLPAPSLKPSVRRSPLLTSVKVGALGGGGIAVLLGTLSVAAEWWALGPHGSAAWLQVTFLPVLLFLLGAACFLVSLPLLRVRPKQAVAILSASIVCVPLSLVALRAVKAVRIAEFRALAQRSQGLVTALRRFEQQRGAPASSLRELVPQFLHSVPRTSLGAYPEFAYAAGPGTIAEATGNAWLLWVDTPLGTLNFDLFVYYPNQRYPRAAHGGVLERVGSWAYVHE